jgi:hypothetical protein
MPQDNVRTAQTIEEAGVHAGLPNAEQAAHRSRKHYAKLVDQYFDYAHSNRLEEVVAMFTDDAFATFVVAPEPFSARRPSAASTRSSSRTTRTSSPRSSPSSSRGTARSASRR